MKTRQIAPAWLYLLIIATAALSQACSAQAPAATLAATALPSPVPAQPTATLPPPTSTPAPTAVPPSVPLSYLPTLADLPPGYEWTLSWVAPHMFDPLTTLAAAQTRYYGPGGWLTAEARVAPAPLEQADKVGEWSKTGKLVETVPVGQSLTAYVVGEGASSIALTFVKGYTQITLSGPITLEAAVALAQTLEARIPVDLPELPKLTFPDILDPVAAAKFDMMKLGKCTDDFKVEAAQAVFSTQEMFTNCVQMDWVAPEPYDSHTLEYAMYDLQNQRFVFKYSSAHGFGTLFMPTQPGQYEMRIAMDGALIAVLPFEMQ